MNWGSGLMKCLRECLRLVSREWNMERREAGSWFWKLQQREDDALDKGGHCGGEEHSVA